MEQRKVLEFPSGLKSKEECREEVTLKRVVFYKQKNGSKHVELCNETALAEECKKRIRKIC